MKGKIRWGIIAPGKIARKFAEDLKRIKEAEVSAVASRNRERAVIFAEEFDVPHVFESYEALFTSNTIDIVYIATPHTFHKELSIQAMRAGKHVLCEKPLGISPEEVEEIVEVAQQEGVFLMEGLWSRFNPTLKKVKAWVSQEKLGKVSYLHADFSFYALDKGMDSRLLNPGLASGSLLDVGIYPVFLSYFLLGVPEKIHAYANFLENGTEIQTSILFKYPNSLAILYSGLVGESKMEAEISGSKGQILIHPRWHESQGFTLKLNDSIEEFQHPILGNGFVPEIEEVHNCLKNSKLNSELWSHTHSLDIAKLLGEIRSQIGARFPFET